MAIRRLHAAAEERRRFMRGSTSYERAAAVETRLNEEVIELAQVAVSDLVDQDVDTRARTGVPTARKGG